MLLIDAAAGFAKVVDQLLQADAAGAVIVEGA